MTDTTIPAAAGVAQVATQTALPAAPISGADLAGAVQNAPVAANQLAT
ncbi:MAG: hypothetical protein ABL925_20505 [Methylococcales bacterium]